MVICDGEEEADGAVAYDRGENFIIINAFALGESASDPSGLISGDFSKGVAFDFVNPFSGNDVARCRFENQVPSGGFGKLVEFCSFSKFPMFAVSAIVGFSLIGWCNFSW